jgi:hypothetical protein
MLVEMPDVGDQHVLEVAATEDQQPVETLPTDAADPALGMGTRLWRAYRRFDDADAFRAEDVVEWLAGQLAGGIVEYDPEAGTWWFLREHTVVLTKPAGANVWGAKTPFHL